MAEPGVSSNLHTCGMGRWLFAVPLCFKLHLHMYITQRPLFSSLAHPKVPDYHKTTKLIRCQHVYHVLAMFC